MFSWFHKKNTFPEVNITEIKKRIRIIAIDDIYDHLPVEGLKRNSFNFEYIDRIDSQMLAEIERGTYDIVIVDIEGIVSPDIAENGWEIIKRLKHANPSIILVAFSGEKFGISSHKYREYYDELVEKPISLATWMTILDDLIKQKITYEHFWKSIEQILQNQNIPQKTIAEIKKKISSNPDDAQGNKQLIEKYLSTGEYAVKIGYIIMKIAGLVHN